MAKFEVKNSEGKKVAEAELAAEVYGIEPNIHVMHHIVKCQMASWRQGTQSAKGVREHRKQKHVLRFPVAARSLGVRRAPAVPARVPSVLPSGVTVASSSPPSPVPTLSV